MVYEICKENVHHFKAMNESPSLNSVKNLFTSLPPDACPEKKHVFGYFIKGELVAYVELIEEYPERNYVLIGTLMVKAAQQRKGIGSAILGSLTAEFKEKGLEYVILSHASNDQVAKNFWQKSGFYETGDVDDCGDIFLVAREKDLRDAPVNLTRCGGNS